MFNSYRSCVFTWYGNNTENVELNHNNVTAYLSVNLILVKLMLLLQCILCDISHLVSGSSFQQIGTASWNDHFSMPNGKFWVWPTLI